MHHGQRPWSPQSLFSATHCQDSPMWPNCMNLLHLCRVVFARPVLHTGSLIPLPSFHSSHGAGGIPSLSKYIGVKNKSPSFTTQGGSLEFFPPGKAHVLRALEGTQMLGRWSGLGVRQADWSSCSSFLEAASQTFKKLKWQGFQVIMCVLNRCLLCIMHTARLCSTAMNRTDIIPILFSKHLQWHLLCVGCL